MKIALVGTHSVGKTTLANAIEANFGIPQKRADKARDFSKKIIAGKRLDELSDDEQLVLQNEMAEALCSIQEGDGPFILDCCSITCFPYAKELISEEGVDGKWLQWLKGKTVQNAFDNLDYILYIPEELPLEDDGFRPKDEEMRARIDLSIRILLGITKKMGGKLFTGNAHPKVRIICGDTNERLHQVSCLVKERLDSRFSKLNHLFTFEGLPKAGKTTQINLLKDDPNVELLPRVGVSPQEKAKLNELYKSKEKNAAFLMESHVSAFKKREYLGALEDNLYAGKTMIQDRGRWTIIAMHLEIQGWEKFGEIMRATFGLSSGNVIWIKTPESVTATRSLRLDDSSLKHDQEFQRRINQNYACLLARVPSTYIVDGEGLVENISRAIRAIVSPSHSLEVIKEKCLVRMEAYETLAHKIRTMTWGSREYAMDLAFQVGSLNHLLLQLHNLADKRGLSIGEIKGKIGEELCDIIYETFAIAEEERIDLPKSWQLKRDYDNLKIKSRILQSKN
jgi:thymidylate kinase/nicotinamide riboside kinase